MTAEQRDFGHVEPCTGVEVCGKHEPDAIHFVRDGERSHFVRAALVVNVIGTPVPQGSKVANHHAPGVRDSNAKKLKPWRAEVAGAVADRMAETGWRTLDEACEVEITFFHQRPGGHYGTGRNAGVLKASAPYWKATAPDADKLARSILDSLTTAQAFRDDGRVARLVVEDRYADAATGARITVRPLTVSPADASSPVRAAGETHPQEVLLP